MNSNTSDTIASIVEAPVLKPEVPLRTFSPQYVEKVFYIWYNHGKPSAKKLIQFIPPELDEWGRVPKWQTLGVWLEEVFVPRANELDIKIKEQLDGMIAKEKIEMLRRHADVGVRMQDMAIDYLNEHRDEISAPAAVRMLVEGIRIERESRGIPAALEKMQHMSDEQLVEEVKNILTATNVKLEELDADSG